ncbi:TPA: hypothetical protein QHD00_003763 [Enterobacter cloacae subsp. cloacae]|nr:hypothetical protein [Enterobacter cloacae subsp. cloacae]HDT6093422.1 hypothetical protein [Enterobacter cloacae subsp. cloacae]
MTIQRREVYLLVKETYSGKVTYVEELQSVSNYFFDGHARVNDDPNGKATHEEFMDGMRPAQVFYVPSNTSGKWQAAFHSFGCYPEMGAPQLEFIIFVGAYSNDHDRTLELMREGMDRAYEVIEGTRQLRDGEFTD